MGKTNWLRLRLGTLLCLWSVAKFTGLPVPKVFLFSGPPEVQGIVGYEGGVGGGGGVS